MPHAYYACDGNGNVTWLIYPNGQVAARYLYDPFGNLLAAVGPLAEANLYRFSSKEWHRSSGLVYYGYRFYDPSLQRWVSRDPVGEKGGINLYGFVENAPNNKVDPYGESPKIVVVAGVCSVAAVIAYCVYQTTQDCPKQCGSAERVKSAKKVEAGIKGKFISITIPCGWECECK
jgi:RHS repeat-associated protein